MTMKLPTEQPDVIGVQPTPEGTALIEEIQRLIKDVESEDEETEDLTYRERLALLLAWDEDEHPRDEQGRFITVGADKSSEGVARDVEALVSRMPAGGAKERTRKHLESGLRSFTVAELTAEERKAVYAAKTGDSTQLGKEALLSAARKGEVTEAVTLYRAGEPRVDGKAKEWTINKGWAENYAETSGRPLVSMELRPGDRALFVPLATPHHVVEVAVLVPPETMERRHALSHRDRLALLLREWDPDEHPRDERGQFAPKSGGGGSAPEGERRPWQPSNRTYEPRAGHRRTDAREVQKLTRARWGASASILRSSEIKTPSGADEKRTVQISQALGGVEVMLYRDISGASQFLVVADDVAHMDLIPTGIGLATVNTDYSVNLAFGQPGVHINPRTGAELTRKEAACWRAASEIAQDMGFNPDDIGVKSYVKVFTVGGSKYNEGGHYNGTTGKILLNSRSVDPTTPSFKGLVAHEITHDAFKSVYYKGNVDRALGRATPEQTQFLEYQEKVMPALQKEDGVTDYSRAYWTKYEKSGAANDRTQAINETYAEISALVQTAKSSGGGDDWSVKPVWRLSHKYLMEAYGKSRA